MPLLFDSLFSSVARSHLLVDVFNSACPVLLTYLGLTETQTGLISTIYIWASALTQPFFGWLSDRAGPRWLAAGGVLWMTVFFSMGGSARGNVIGGHFGDRYTKRQVAAVALLFAALPIYVMSQIGWSPWLYVLIPLAGACTGSIHSIVVVIAQRKISGGMALASGLILGFIFSAGALGLLFTGPLVETYGFPTVLVLTTGLVLIASPLALMLKEKTANPD